MNFFPHCRGVLYPLVFARFLLTVAALLPFSLSWSYSIPFNDSICPFDISGNGLGVGDKIPERFWDISLAVVNHPDGQEYILLIDYRRKLIVLDFWNTWCSACIEGMPKLDSVRKSIDKDVVVLPVTYQSKTYLI